MISAQPVPVVPGSWSVYQSASSAFRFHPSTNEDDRTGKSADWPWEYSYIDLDKRSSHPLVLAPSDFVTGFGDAFQASWSRDGKEVLFTSSYLPLPKIGPTSVRESVKPCAVAIYRVASGTVACITYARFPDQNEHLRSAVFGRSNDEVVLKWLNNGTEAVEMYARDGNSWRLTNTDRLAEAGSNLMLSLHQDIDEPPSLWATDRIANTSKML